MFLSQTVHYSSEIIQTSDLNVVTKHSEIHTHSGTMGFPTVIKIFLSKSTYQLI